MIEHRHLTPEVGWSKAAIDSALERGSLAEWRELFSLARRDQALAASVLEIAERHPMPGVLPIVEHILRQAWPNLIITTK
ncbi:MAG: hypothetical protein WD971_08495 [Pirellulales bacterium]